MYLVDLPCMDIIKSQWMVISMFSLHSAQKCGTLTMEKFFIYSNKKTNPID